ncbi:uncharacterized protein F4822DRAFT_445730 [Hypoxylon trugodes]|uniref:uncharacterized protein n=1 Tax=Hypoxylon trugodes TaxID=326681 RepID=UPI00218EA264|nr:uncharacterized protein F4822DRAFT_445730 [Hypoxylon trugodes]KAI1385866.1 hypothetical protein F4822DRAFT_445730 [Hypoxylon trugodes]
MLPPFPQMPPVPLPNGYGNMHILNPLRQPTVSTPKTYEFTKFNLLPAEIRLKIWKYALHNDARHRIVLMDKQRVVPYAYLCSPLLEACYEGREVAKEFYNIRVPVYHVAEKGSESRLNSYLPRGYGPPLFPPRGRATEQEQVRQRLDRHFSNMAHEHTRVYEAFSTSKGFVYVNLEHDTFMLGEFLNDQMLEYWWEQGIASGEITSPPRGAKKISRYISSAMDFDDCARIRKIIRVTYNSRGKQAVYCPLGDADLYWHKHIFQGFETYKTFACPDPLALLQFTPKIVEFQQKTDKVVLYERTAEWCCRRRTHDFDDAIIEMISPMTGDYISLMNKGSAIDFYCFAPAKMLDRGDQDLKFHERSKPFGRDGCRIMKNRPSYSHYTSGYMEASDSDDGLTSGLGGGWH